MNSLVNCLKCGEKLAIEMREATMTYTNTTTGGGRSLVPETHSYPSLECPNKCKSTGLIPAGTAEKAKELK